MKTPKAHLGQLMTKENMIYDESGETLATFKYKRDAEVAVKAVNMHTKLVEALKAISYLGDRMEQETGEDEPIMDTIRELLKQAEQ